MEAESEAVWLTGDHEFALEELAQICGLTEAELREFVEYGAITPVDPQARQWVFKAGCVVTVRAACRLRSSFELEPHGVALVIALLDRIRDLETELGSLRAQMPRRR